MSSVVSLLFGRSLISACSLSKARLSTQVQSSIRQSIEESFHRCVEGEDCSTDLRQAQGQEVEGRAPRGRGGR